MRLGGVSFSTEHLDHDVKCRIAAFLGANAGAKIVTDRNPADTPAPGAGLRARVRRGRPWTGPNALGRGPLRQLRKAKLDVIPIAGVFLSTDLEYLNIP